MHVAFVTDLHITQARLQEHEPVLKQLALSIWDKEPDLVLVGGDLCGLRVPHRATPDERNALVDFLRTIVDDRGTPIVVVRGNHDAPGDFDFLDHLAIDVTYMDEPGVVEGDTWAVVCLPWVDRTGVSDPEDYQREVRAWYHDELHGYLSSKDRRPHVFVLGHAAIKGAVLRDGQPAVPIADPVIPLSDLDGDFRAGFFGHYHQPQILKPADPLIVYGGSVNVNEHGEDHRKTWTEWTPEGIRLHRISTPARVTMIVDDLGKTLEVRPADADLDDLGKADRLKVRVVAQADRMDQAITTGRRIRAKHAEGVRSVTVEYDTQVQHRTREGAEDVAARTAIPDKVKLYLDRKRPKIKGSLKAEALQILDELLEEVGATRWE